jgi:hypothetical protein
MKKTQSDTVPSNPTTTKVKAYTSAHYNRWARRGAAGNSSCKPRYFFNFLEAGHSQCTGDETCAAFIITHCSYHTSTSDHTCTTDQNILNWSFTPCPLTHQAPMWVFVFFLSLCFSAILKPSSRAVNFATIYWIHTLSIFPAEESHTTPAKNKFRNEMIFYVQQLM